MDINFILRLVTLALLIIWRIYWFLTAKNASAKKPKINNDSRIPEQIYNILAASYVFINLFGFVVFPFNNSLIQNFGFILVVSGFFLSISARKTLDDNWTESYEYQIKKKHELITNGIYKYVRHPIYGGILMMINGALILAGSYTSIIFFTAMLLTIESYAKREEKLLTKHFGRKYIEYKKTTKKFIPFIY